MRRRIGLLATLLLVPLLLAPVLLLPREPHAAEPARATAMVAAANPLAAAAGMAMLRAGGNAMDAAVAVQLALGVVEPQNSGIGGGAFLLHYDAASGAVTSWNGRETAPAAARPNLLLDNSGNPVPFYDAVLGGRSVGVPGTLRMLEAAHRAQGRLPWASLAEPAIRLAAEGFQVPPLLGRAIAANGDRLKRQDAARAFFFAPDGTPLAEGATLTNPALADSLRSVAAEGADALYRGPIAADIAATVRSDPNPGLMTTDDLAAYRPQQLPPICGTYLGHRICGMGPPSSGGVAVLQIMRLLEHFDVADMPPDGLDTAQMVVEAERLAYADRDRYLADADFVPVPVAGLIAPDYLEQRAQVIDLDHAMPSARAGNPSWNGAMLRAAPQPAQPEHGTSHVCIVDAQGNAVSMTTTIEDTFGARLMVRGFMLNNEMTDFSFRPEIDGRPVANRVEPGKRPRSAMAPTLVFDAAGRLEACVGSAGGARIIGYVVQALTGLLAWGQTPEAALARPHVLSTGQTADLEAGTAATALGEGLAARGQKVRETRLESGSMAIVVTPSGLVGGADPRRDGVALGGP